MPLLVLTLLSSRSDVFVADALLLSFAFAFTFFFCLDDFVFFRRRDFDLAPSLDDDDDDDDESSDELSSLLLDCRLRFFFALTTFVLTGVSPNFAFTFFASGDDTISPGSPSSESRRRFGSFRRLFDADRDLCARFDFDLDFLLLALLERLFRRVDDDDDAFFFTTSS